LGNRVGEKAPRGNLMIKPRRPVVVWKDGHGGSLIGDHPQRKRTGKKKKPKSKEGH